jgi:hypothetical protein
MFANIKKTCGILELKGVNIFKIELVGDNKDKNCHFY